jgi:hypothetical protein
MADLAREEADRLFSSRDPAATHPEDRDRASEESDDQIENTIRSSSKRQESDDEDSANMATMTATRTSYRIPSTIHHANTGPKGVIADAQSFARAKQSSFRSKFAYITNSFKTQPSVSEKAQSKAKSGSSNSDIALSEEDSDSEFMNTWRQTRIQELSQKQAQATRRVSPSRRTWGTLSDVDAIGYLDAIEKVSDDDVVIVMIYDPSSSQSAEVEDELQTLAYKYSTTRFIKLHQEIAEMESVEVPAVLAYKAGDVIATVSGAKSEGLEDVLKKQRVLAS